MIVIGTKERKFFEALLGHKGTNSTSFFLFNPAKHYSKMAFSSHFSFFNGYKFFQNVLPRTNDGGPSREFLMH